MAGQEVAAEEQARLASPEGVAAREATQTKFEGLSAEQAGNVDGEAFPVVINQRAGGPPKLPEGDRIASFPSDHAMSVAGNGSREVRETLEPVAFEASPGQRTPLNLALTEIGGAFEPQTALAPVRIPKHLNEGASLSEAGVSLTPVDERGATLASKGVLDGASVFYGDSEAASAGIVDVDTLVKPSTFGLMMETMLRSQRSPSRLFFKVGLPQEAAIEPEAPGSGFVTVVQGGRKLAVIFAPTAQDAQGRLVPVSMVVEGDTLVVTVAHPKGTYAYPITVDPRYEYYASEFTWDEQIENSGSHRTNWHFEHSGSLFTGSEVGGGLGWSMQVSGSHGEHEWGAMVYTTRGLSHIWDFASETAQHENETRVESRAELASANGVESETALSPEVTEPVWNIAQYCRLGEKCKVTPATNNSATYVALAAGAGTGKAGENVFREAEVAVQQEVNPEVQFDTTDETVNGHPNALYGTKTWLGPHSNALVKFTAADKGIGIEGWSSEHVNSTGSWESLSEKSMMAEGRCEGIQCPPEVVEYIGYSSAFPDGEPKFGLDAWNAEYDSHAKENESESLRRHAVKVDSTPPHNITLAGLSNGNEIGEREYTLKVEAIDGSGTTPSSGVKSIAVAIDRHELGAANGSCPKGPCTATGEWQLNGGEFGVGEHELVVTATDNAGNVATEHFALKVHHASAVALGPGAVNPLTGEFSLNATDASATAPGASLTVSRSYQSRHLTAGAEGPLGPQWVLSVGGQQSIVRSESNVTLDAASGGQTTFTSNGKGGFTSPNGDANLSLTEAKNAKGELTEYVLKNAAEGKITRFTSMTGPAGTLWKPTTQEQEGPLTAQKVSYTYRTVEGVTEPVEALAPPPAGVSCGTEIKELKAGCRALEFKYATETNAGEGSSEWKEFKGRLTEVKLVAWNGKEMQKLPVAQYAYDATGHLRAEWNPQISPTLKTVYGYDSEGHVTALTPPGQESWAFTYGTIAGDANAGRLLKLTRAPVASGLWGGEGLKNTVAPKLSGPAAVGLRMGVSTGTWTNAPVAYGYQWKECNSEGKACTPIPGATNPNYTPTESELGSTLVAVVSATNGGGTVGLATTASAKVQGAEISEFAAAGSNPIDIAEGADKNLWFANNGNSKIAKITTAGAITEYALPASSFPRQVVEGADKNIWFTDDGTGKIGKVTTSGTITEYTGPPSTHVYGLVAGPDGNMWFTESSTGKIGKITTAGTITEYVLPAGSWPVGIATGPDKNLWFTEAGTNKIGKSTTAGVITEYALPKGSYPSTIVTGPDNNLWFTENESNKIGKITTAGVITEYAVPKGSGLSSITVGPDGNLWFVASSTKKIGRITTAGVITEYATETGTPDDIAAGPDGNLWYTINSTTSRIGKLNPSPTQIEVTAPQPGSTVEYHVSLSGTGLPTLTSSETEKWGQKDNPTEGMALFPPDEPQGWPASDYKRASITYLDEADHVVNTASPSGAISTTEYNATNDVVRTLSPDNRIAALKEGTKSAEASKRLDSQSTYSSEGTELVSTLGPQHTVKLANGTTVEARDHQQYSYDEGAPSEGGPFRLVTKVAQGAQVNGEADRDVRTVTTSYSGQENLGWKLREPTSVTTDPSGLKLTHTTVYDPATGNAVEVRGPGGGAGGGSGGSETSSPPVYASQFGSQGTKEGQFETPEGVAVDPSSGSVYVADYALNRVEKFTASGVFVAWVGSATSGSGEGQLSHPESVAVSASGNVYVGDAGNHRVEEFNAEGKYVRAFGKEGTGEGQFGSTIYGLAFDSSGKLWASDGANHRVEKFSETGVFEKKYGEKGSGEGQLEEPRGVTVSGGNVYVVDTVNDRVVELSTEAKFVSQFGKYGLESGQLREPWGIAADSKGDLYVADRWPDLVEEFSPTGSFVAWLGSSGSGEGQFNDPDGLASDATGDLYVADQGNHRIQKWAASAGGETVYPPVFASAFGGLGSGSGQFKEPCEVAFDSSGNVWVVDAENGRIEKWSSTGTFIAAYGSKGSGNLQFSRPYGIAINQSTGNVYVGDYGNNRVEELSSAGAYVASFGTSGEGALKEPMGVKLDGSGNVYVVDRGHSRIVEFKAEGTYVRSFGSAGSSNGQLKEPMGLAISEGSLYVADFGNNRVEQFSPSGTYLGQFGTVGSGAGQFKEPFSVATNPTTGNLYVADLGNQRVDEFSSTGHFLTDWETWGPAHQLSSPIAVAVGATGKLYVSDVNGGKVSTWTPPEAGAAHLSYASQFGSGGTGGGQFSTPINTVIDGEGNLWVTDLGNNRIEKFSSSGAFVKMIGWGVSDGKSELEVCSSSCKAGLSGSGSGQFNGPGGIDVNKSTGNIYVADTYNARVEEFSSSGSFIAKFGTEGSGKLTKPGAVKIDSAGNVWVPDITANKIFEYTATGSFIASYGKEGSGTGEVQFKKPIAVALSGENLYIADSANHRVEEISNKGAFVRVFGTEGAGSGELYDPEGIAADAAGNLYVTDSVADHIEEFNPTGGYMATFASKGSGEGQLKEPIGDAIDTAGNLYVVDTGNNRIEKFGSAAAVGPYATQMIYYTAAANSKYPGCGEHPEWANLPCQSQPTKQPETGGLPKLPVEAVKYNIWDEPETTTTTVGSATRTTTLTYDAAGRMLTTETASTEGKVLPKVTSKYSESTGQLIEQSTGSGSETKAIKTTYNTLGQLLKYTDAEGNTSEYEYEPEKDVRLIHVNDGKGTQAYTYEETTGYLAKVVDTQGTNVLTFTGSHDAEGNLTGEGYPNGMTAALSYNPSGETTGLAYEKTTHCTEKCVWYSESLVSSIHGQTLEDANSLATNGYTYDEAGRLTEARETPAAEYCKTRIYTYDEESNRTALTTREPNSKKECGTEGGTVAKHTYDEADRLTDSGIVYDTFGDITKLPAADAGGTELQSTYYVDGQVGEQKQGEQTIGYQLDPTGRPAETVDTGAVSSTYQTHYTGSGNSPSWTVEPISGHWTRYVGGFGGLAAIETSSSEPVLQLGDLHGDIVARASMSETATKLLSTERSTEFGVSTISKPEKYSWLGGDLLPTELPSGVVAMGARSYVPEIGRFLQTDPIPGGTNNPYAYTNGNPVNETDLTGEFVENGYLGGIFATQNQEAIEKEAAREAAVRAEAERKAQEAAWAAEAAAKMQAELEATLAQDRWDEEAAAGPPGAGSSWCGGEYGPCQGEGGGGGGGGLFGGLATAAVFHKAPTPQCSRGKAYDPFTHRCETVEPYKPPRTTKEVIERGMEAEQEYWEKEFHAKLGGDGLPPDEEGGR